nr:TPA: Proteasome/cyclosome repeat-containing protein [Neospora caninum Liverpool]
MRLGAGSAEKENEGESGDMEAEDAEEEPFEGARRPAFARRCGSTCAEEEEKQRASEASETEEDLEQPEKRTVAWVSFLNLPPTAPAGRSLGDAPSPSLEVLWVCDRPEVSLCLAYAVETRRCVVCLLFGRGSAAVSAGHWRLRRAQAAVGEGRPPPARPHAASPFHEQLETRLFLSAPSLHALQLTSFLLPGDEQETVGESAGPETEAAASERSKEGDRDPRRRGLLPTFLFSPPPQLLLLPTRSIRPSRWNKRKKGRKDTGARREEEAAEPQGEREQAEGEWEASRQMSCGKGRRTAGDRPLAARRLPRPTQPERRAASRPCQERLRLALLDERTDTLVLVPLPPASSLSSDSPFSSAAASCSPPCLHLNPGDLERIEDVVGFVALSPDQTDQAEGSPISLPASHLHSRRVKASSERSPLLSFSCPTGPAPSLPSYLLVLHRGGLLALYAGASLLSFLRLRSPLALSPSLHELPVRPQRDTRPDYSHGALLVCSSLAASSSRKTEKRESERQTFPVALSNPVANRFNLTILRPPASICPGREDASPSASLSRFVSSRGSPTVRSLPSASSGLSTVRCAVQLGPAHPLLSHVTTRLLSRLPPRGALRLLRALFLWCLNPRALAALTEHENRDFEPLRSCRLATLASQFVSSPDASSGPLSPSLLRQIAASLPAAGASERSVAELEWRAFCLLLLAESLPEAFLASSRSPSSPAPRALPSASVCRDSRFLVSHGNAAFAAAHAVAQRLREAERDQLGEVDEGEEEGEGEGGGCAARGGEEGEARRLQLGRMRRGANEGEHAAVCLPGKRRRSEACPRSEGEDVSRGRRVDGRGRGAETGRSAGYLDETSAIQHQPEASRSADLEDAGEQTQRVAPNGEAADNAASPEDAPFRFSPSVFSASYSRQQCVRQAADMLLRDATRESRNAERRAREVQEEREAAGETDEEGGKAKKRKTETQRLDAVVRRFACSPFLGPLVEDLLEEEEGTESRSPLSLSAPDCPSPSLLRCPREPSVAFASYSVSPAPLASSASPRGRSPAAGAALTPPSFRLAPFLPQIFLTLHEVLQDLSLLQETGELQRSLACLLLLLSRALLLPAFASFYATHYLSVEEARRLEALFVPRHSPDGPADESGTETAKVSARRRHEEAETGEDEMRPVQEAAEPRVARGAREICMESAEEEREKEARLKNPAEAERRDEDDEEDERGDEGGDEGDERGDEGDERGDEGGDEGDERGDEGDEHEEEQEEMEGAALLTEMRRGTKVLSVHQALETLFSSPSDSDCRADLQTQTAETRKNRKGCSLPSTVPFSSSPPSPAALSSVASSGPQAPDRSFGFTPGKRLEAALSRLERRRRLMGSLSKETPVSSVAAEGGGVGFGGETERRRATAEPSGSAPSSLSLSEKENIEEEQRQHAENYLFFLQKTRLGEGKEEQTHIRRNVSPPVSLSSASRSTISSSVSFDSSSFTRSSSPPPCSPFSPFTLSSAYSSSAPSEDATGCGPAADGRAFDRSLSATVLEMFRDLQTARVRKRRFVAASPSPGVSTHEPTQRETSTEKTERSLRLPLAKSLHSSSREDAKPYLQQVSLLTRSSRSSFSSACRSSTPSSPLSSVLASPSSFGPCLREERVCTATCLSLSREERSKDREKKTRAAWRLIRRLQARLDAGTLSCLVPCLKLLFSEIFDFLSSSASDLLGTRAMLLGERKERSRDRKVKRGTGGYQRLGPHAQRAARPWREFPEEGERDEAFVKAVMLVGRADLAANARLLLPSVSSPPQAFLALGGEMVVPEPKVPRAADRHGGQAAPQDRSPGIASRRAVCPRLDASSRAPPVGSCSVSAPVRDLRELLHFEASGQSAGTSGFSVAPREVDWAPASPLGEKGVLSRWGGVAPHMETWLAARGDLRPQLCLVASALDSSSLRLIDSRLSPQAADVVETLRESQVLALAPPFPGPAFASATASPLREPSASAFLAFSSSLVRGVAAPPAGARRGGAPGPDDDGRSTAVPLLQKLSPLDAALALASRDRGVALQQALAVGRGALTLGALGRWDDGDRQRESLPLSLLDVPPLELRVVLAPYALVAKDEEALGEEETGTRRRDEERGRRGRREERNGCRLSSDDDASDGSEGDGSRRAFSPRSDLFDSPLASRASQRTVPSFSTAPLAPPTSLFAAASSEPQRQAGHRTGPHASPISFVSLPAQLISRDPQRQPPERDAWAQFHNGCSAGLTLFPVSGRPTAAEINSLFSVSVSAATSRQLRTRWPGRTRSGDSSGDSGHDQTPGRAEAEGQPTRQRSVGTHASALSDAAVASGEQEGGRQRGPDQGVAPAFPSPFSPSPGSGDIPKLHRGKDALSHHEQLVAFLRRHGEAYGPHEFGGLLLALGLAGFFRPREGRKEDMQNLSLRLLWDAFDRETVQTGLLLGLASSAVGSRSSSLLQLCVAHLPYTLVGKFIEIEMKPAPQCAALLALGLVFAGSQSACISALLLHHLLRSPCLLSDKQGLDRDAYALSTAWALGLIWLGHARGGKSVRGEKRRGETGRTPRGRSGDSEGEEASRAGEATHPRGAMEAWPHGEHGTLETNSDTRSTRTARRGRRDAEAEEKQPLSFFWRELVTLANLNTSRPWGSFYREPLTAKVASLRQVSRAPSTRFSLFSPSTERGARAPSDLPLLQETWFPSPAAAAFDGVGRERGEAIPRVGGELPGETREAEPAASFAFLFEKGDDGASSFSNHAHRSNLHWGCLNASEVSAPAALALGLAFLDSDNDEIRRGLRIPKDADQLKDILPHVLLCKVLARALISWSAIVPSHRWIAAQIPPPLRVLPSDSTDAVRTALPFLRVVCPRTHRIRPVEQAPRASGDRRGDMRGDTDSGHGRQGRRQRAAAASAYRDRAREGNRVERTRRRASEREDKRHRPSAPASSASFPFSSAAKYRVYALAGALWALGLRYAGTNSRCCLHLLLRYLDYLRGPGFGRSSLACRGRHVASRRRGDCRPPQNEQEPQRERNLPEEDVDMHADGRPDSLAGSAVSDALGGSCASASPVARGWAFSRLLSRSQCALFRALPARFSLPLPESPQLAFASAAAYLDEEARDLCVLVCCLALACVAAGSCSSEVLSCLFAERRLRLSRPRPETAGGAAAVAAAAAAAAAEAAAGLASGDTARATAAAETAASCARAAEENQMHAQYGACLLIHQAIGLVCMSGGRRSFADSLFTPAVLLMALFPLKPPTDAADQSSHLQAARHIWVLATEWRHVAPVDVETGKRVSLPVTLLVKRAGDLHGRPERKRVKKVQVWLPGQLPSPRRILHLEVAGDRHLPLVLRRLKAAEPVEASDATSREACGRRGWYSRGHHLEPDAPPCLFSRLLHLGGFFVKKNPVAGAYEAQPVSCQRRQAAPSRVARKWVALPRPDPSYSASLSRLLLSHVERLERWRHGEEGEEEERSGCGTDLFSNDTDGSPLTAAEKRRFGARGTPSPGDRGAALLAALEQALPAVAVDDWGDGGAADRTFGGDRTERVHPVSDFSFRADVGDERSDEREKAAEMLRWRDCLCAGPVSVAAGRGRDSVNGFPSLLPLRSRGDKNLESVHGLATHGDSPGRGVLAFDARKKTPTDSSSFFCELAAALAAVSSSSELPLGPFVRHEQRVEQEKARVLRLEKKQNARRLRVLSDLLTVFSRQSLPPPSAVLASRFLGKFLAFFRPSPASSASSLSLPPPFGPETACRLSLSPPTPASRPCASSLWRPRENGGRGGEFPASSGWLGSNPVHGSVASSPSLLSLCLGEVGVVYYASTAATFLRLIGGSVRGEFTCEEAREVRGRGPGDSEERARQIETKREQKAQETLAPKDERETEKKWRTGGNTDLQRRKRATWCSESTAASDAEWTVETQSSSRHAGAEADREKETVSIADAFSSFLVVHRLPLLDDWLRFVRWAVRRRSSDMRALSLSAPARRRAGTKGRREGNEMRALPSEPAYTEAETEAWRQGDRAHTPRACQQALHLAHLAAPSATVEGKRLLADALMEANKLVALL